MEKRKVITRRGRHPRGFFPSMKTGMSITWESTLERDALYLFEFSPGVRSYREYQIQEIYYDDAGNPKRYYPDFVLELTNGTEVLVEVKPEARLKQTAVRKKMEQIAARFQACGRPFLILTDRDIRRLPRLENLKHFAYHAGQNAEPEMLPNIAGYLMYAGVKTIDEAEKLVGIQVLSELIRDGLVSCPWDEPINAASLISITLTTEGGSHDALLF